MTSKPAWLLSVTTASHITIRSLGDIDPEYAAEVLSRYGQAGEQ